MAQPIAAPLYYSMLPKAASSQLINEIEEVKVIFEYGPKIEGDGQKIINIVIVCESSSSD